MMMMAMMLSMLLAIVEVPLLYNVIPLACLHHRVDTYYHSKMTDDLFSFYSTSPNYSSFSRRFFFFSVNVHNLFVYLFLYFWFVLNLSMFLLEKAKSLKNIVKTLFCLFLTNETTKKVWLL